MKIKDILINSDKLRFFVFPNVLILYVYLQIIFLFIYPQINKTFIYLSQTDIATENMFDIYLISQEIKIFPSPERFRRGRGCLSKANYICG